MRIAILDTALETIKSKLGLEQLSAREQIILAVGGLFIAGVIVYQVIVSPYLDARSRLLNSIERKKEELAQIRQLKQDYSDLRIEEGGIKANLAKRSPGFTLFAFLDQQAERAKVKQQIKYMKPSVISGDDSLDESVVEMKLEEVTLEQLVEFLRLTESDVNVVSIRRMSIQTSSREQGYLDVILQIVTLVEAG